MLTVGLFLSNKVTAGQKLHGELSKVRQEHRRVLQGGLPRSPRFVVANCAINLASRYRSATSSPAFPELLDGLVGKTRAILLRPRLETLPALHAKAWAAPSKVVEMKEEVVEVLPGSRAASCQPGRASPHHQAPLPDGHPAMHSIADSRNLAPQIQYGAGHIVCFQTGPDGHGFGRFPSMGC